MKHVFADTHYWIAITVPTDPWASAAKQAKSAIGNVRLVTTDEVLVEYTTALCSYGQLWRAKAVTMVRSILNNPNVSVIPQTRESFLNGLKRYESRPDKTYSLTDCVSMNQIEKDSIKEVLTNDHHFEQEGFTVLIKKEE